MKYVHCNYCNQDNTELVNRGPDLLLNRPGDFHLVRCRHCGLIYQNPQLSNSELLQHYPEDYLPYMKDLRSEKSLFRRFDLEHGLARRCQRVMRHCTEPGILLDVGCATGLFMNAMRERGWRVAGVELSPYAAEYARQTFHLDVFAGTLEAAAYPDDSFNVVTLWDVFEHLPNPKATLAEIARILKPGGLVTMSLPNPTSVEANLFGSNWVGWDRPRHLHLFTPAVLRCYLQDAGVIIESIESFSGRLGLTLLSVEFLCKARGMREEKWQRWLKLAYSWPLRVASWPLYWLGEAMNKTTVMTVFGRLESRD